MKRWGPLLGVFAFALAVRSLLAAIPFERDEGVYAYVAQRWRQGEIPYRDAFDHKPPGVAAAYAAMLLVAGDTASPAAVHWLTQLYSLATLAVTYAIARRRISERAAFVAAGLAAILLADVAVLGNESNSEIFQILPQTAALGATMLAMDRRSLRWSFLAGALLGTAVLFKQTAVVMVVPAAAFAWYGTRRAVAALALAGGALVPLAATVVYFVAHGAGAALYECTVTYNRAYASTVSLSAYPAAFAASLWAFAASAWPVLALAVYALVVVTRGRASEGKRPVHAFVGAWAAFSLASLGAGGRFFPHYWIVMVPPLALLAAIAVEALASSSFQTSRSRAILWTPLVVAALAVVAAHPWYYAPGLSGEEKVWRLYGLNPFAESARVAAFLRERSGPEDSVLVVGSEPQLLYYAARRSASRFPYLYPLGLSGPEAEGRQAQVLAELERERPRLVVTEFAPQWWESVRPQALLDGVRTALARDYAVVAVLPGNRRGPALLRIDSEAQALFQRYPYWYEGPTPWSLAVWQRLDR